MSDRTTRVVAFRVTESEWIRLQVRALRSRKTEAQYVHDELFRKHNRVNRGKDVVDKKTLDRWASIY